MRGDEARVHGLRHRRRLERGAIGARVRLEGADAVRAQHELEAAEHAGALEHCLRRLRGGLGDHAEPQAGGREPVERRLRLRERRHGRHRLERRVGAAGVAGREREATCQRVAHEIGERCVAAAERQCHRARDGVVERAEHERPLLLASAERPRHHRRVEQGAVEVEEDEPQGHQTTRPWRTVFSLTTRGSTNWSRYAGPPAFVPVPDRRLPPNGWRATMAPVTARFT